MKFSIVTICLNAECYLAETVNSVLSQDWKDFEYIFVDGGSSDRTRELIESYARQDSRIDLFVETKPGIAHAMNYGLKRAQGNVVAFLHADDRYAGSTTLSTVAKTFQINLDALWVTGGLREIDQRGQTTRELPVRRFNRNRLLRNNIIYHPSTFVKRAAMQEVGGFDENLRYAMDYDLWLRLSELSAPGLCEYVLAEFRVHERSLSSVERVATMDEEYLVRQKYLKDNPARRFHQFYQWLRLRCLERRGR